MVRTGPEFVDGDLEELDYATLAALRGEVARIDGPAYTTGLYGVVAAGATKQHRLRQEAQVALRQAIALWAGGQKAAGRSDSESYRRFYFAFGIDVMTAQALGRREAEELMERVVKYREV